MGWIYTGRSMTNLLQPHALSDAEHFLELARGVLDIEAQAVQSLKHRLGAAFLEAHRMLLGTKGRAVVTGIGKSGHVAGKMLWYALGRLGSRVTQPSLRRWIDRARAVAERHPRLGVGVVAASASVSLPPFHLMAIAAGIVRAPILPFFLVAFAGRLLRFGVLAAFPSLLRYVMS